MTCQRDSTSTFDHPRPVARLASGDHELEFHSARLTEAWAAVKESDARIIEFGDLVIESLPDD